MSRAATTDRLGAAADAGHARRTGARPRSTTTSRPAATKGSTARCASSSRAAVTQAVIGLRPARPRRRRLQHRPQVEHHAARRRRAAAQVRGLQRRRDGARQHQGPLPDGPQPAPAARGHDRSPATRCRPTPGYIFLRAQYDQPMAALERALDEARERGYLGRDIMGTGFSFDIYLHESIGRYICGEASAMLNALESQRPNPRARPPHMTGAGLYSRPTVVNNVESYAAVPGIVRNGVEWWKGLSPSRPRAAPRSTASPGASRRPGCVELPVGTSLRELIEVHAGGMLPGYELRGRRAGRRLDGLHRRRRHRRAPSTSTSLETVGSRLGTGTAVLLDDQTCPIGMLLNMQQFFAQESCGWCTPCREGLQWTVKLLRDIEEGRGRPRVPRPARRTRSGTWAPTGRSATWRRAPCSRWSRRSSSSATTSSGTSPRAAAATRRRGSSAAGEAAGRTVGAMERQRRHRRARHRRHRRPRAPRGGGAQHARHRPVARLRPAVLLLAPA